MTDSPGAHAGEAVDRRPGKRERLVAAACRLLHEQGVEGTTIADIAKAADVPLGNVYYYFKTKDEIVSAVVDAHVRDIEATLGEIDRRHRTPKARLKALVGSLAEQGELVARHGCPHGTLCSELEKRAGGSDPAAARLIQVPLEWAERQFGLMGRRDARDLAVDLIAAYHGSALLTNAFGEPDLMSRQARRLERWIDSLDHSA